MKSSVKISLFSLLLLSCFTTASQAGMFMHGFSSNTNLYQVDTSTGTETLIGSTGINNMGGIALGQLGLYGLTTTGQLYSINSTTAAATLVGNTGVGSIEGLAFSTDGATLYASGGSRIYSINTSTGAATSLGAIGMSDVDGLTVAPVSIATSVGTFSAGTIFATDSNSVYAIDANTFSTTLIGSTSANEAIAFDSAGNLFGHNFNNALFSIDTLTLSATLVANTSGPITGLTGDQIGGGIVPEPSSLALWSIGGIGLVLRRRRR